MYEIASSSSASSAMYASLSSAPHLGDADSTRRTSNVSSSIWLTPSITDNRRVTANDADEGQPEIVAVNLVHTLAFDEHTLLVAVVVALTGIGVCEYFGASENTIAFPTAIRKLE